MSSSPEDLARRLEDIREANWIENRAKQIARWPGLKRRTIRTLLEPFKDKDQWDWKLHARRLEQAKDYTSTLSRSDRQALWQKLFPKLASHLERAWEGIPHRTYLQTLQRFPFRAPRHTETVNTSQARFLLGLSHSLHGLDQDAEWLAAWAPHLDDNQYDGWIAAYTLAGVLSSGGPEADAVRNVLVDSMQGEHEIGQMGYHVIIAFLNSNVRDDWERVGNLLLAAQRQEGLRQNILELIDEAQPAAFRYMLGVILENNLERFSATVRAFDCWLGTQWAGGSVTTVRKGVQRLVELMDDADAREEAIANGEAQDAYLALWVTALEDAEQTLARLRRIVNTDPSAERRYVAVRLAERIGLEPDSITFLVEHLTSGKETDPRIEMACVSALQRVEFNRVPPVLFDTAAKLFDRLPHKPPKAEPIVWPWAEHPLDRRIAAELMQTLAKNVPEKLIPYAQALSGTDCVRVIHSLAGLGEAWENGDVKPRKRRKLTPEARCLVIELVGDSRKAVQGAAFEALAPLPVEEDEIERLMGLLHRNSAPLRAGAIDRLRKLPDDRAIEICSQLLGDADRKKKAAGLELAAALCEANRERNRIAALIEQNRENLVEPELVEAANRLVQGEVETATLDDCLGLVPRSSRTVLPEPQYVGVEIQTKAAKAAFEDVATLFMKVAETEIEVPSNQSKERVLLGAAGWRLSAPKPDVDPITDARENLPLVKTWQDWLVSRKTALHDSDGLELVRLWARIHEDRDPMKKLPAPFKDRESWSLLSTFGRILDWILVLSGIRGGCSLLIQSFEDALAKHKPSDDEKKDRFGWRKENLPTNRNELLRHYMRIYPHDITPESRSRLAMLKMIAVERDVRGCSQGPSLEEFTAAFEQGLLNESDFIWMLLKPRTPRYVHSETDVEFGPIRFVTRLQPDETFVNHPRLQAAVERMRDRIIELELTRGERLGPASLPAAEVRHAGDAEVLFKLITALGKDKLVRQQEWGNPTRAYSFSRLMLTTLPTEDDTPERFAQLAKDADIKPARLREIAMFAPQWAEHIQHTLDEAGLEDAVWWIQAHTKQNSYWRDSELRDIWASRISERTELEADDLEEGAVDVAWFRRIIKTVGLDGWDKLQTPAKYASSSGGHKRATLFADAMLDRVKVDDLIHRIDDKRHQDSVRALGLVPLPKKASDARAESLRRYNRLQEFKRESRKFGSQRQESEGRSVEIGMQNLARTAGYRDPQRLQWAMETEAVTDLAKGPVTIQVDETSVSLAITPEGDPALTVVKKGRTLKNIPVKLRKQEDIAELKSRVTELRRQKSRMRLSLEEAMCRGDLFTSHELREMANHPMLRLMLERLIFLGEGALIGYLDKDGQVLRDHTGKLEPIGKRDSLRLAHPIDLLARGDWSAWQRECFAAERVQPFKQIFREVYPKTESELDQCDFTRRYAGHQVNPRQAMSILKRRQWIAAPGEGLHKTFHDEDLIAQVWFQESFYTPADVEGLTLEGVTFSRPKKRTKHLPLSDIPNRLFSEAMRDLDLLVSVAHCGGVDPEASASTVEMRAALVKETCQLLGLSNVRIDGHHAKIDGTLASYGVHLGSATTMVIPGKALIIVAVHSQYRGRLFLPFADDDPKTAEVLAKVLLLARDDEIKDASILSQIRH